MNFSISPSRHAIGSDIASRAGMLAEDLDYHVVRASMVIMFFFIGYRSGFRMSSKDWSRSSATGR
jgi:hypothetical protein